MLLLEVGQTVHTKTNPIHCNYRLINKEINKTTQATILKLTINSFSGMSTSVKPQTHHKNNTTATHTHNSLSQKQDKKHMDSHGTHEMWTMQPKPACCKGKDLERISAIKYSPKVSSLKKKKPSCFLADRVMWSESSSSASFGLTCNLWDLDSNNLNKVVIIITINQLI